MQKTKHFAMGGIFTSIVILLFQSFYTANSVTVKNDTENNNIVQNNTNGGGTGISERAAKDLIDNFQKANPSFNGKRGFFISKSAIDALFIGDLNSNGVICCPTLDNGEISMVMCATYSSDTRISGAADVYISESYCPNICGILGQ